MYHWKVEKTTKLQYIYIYKKRKSLIKDTNKILKHYINLK